MDPSSRCFIAGNLFHCIPYAEGAAQATTGMVPDDADYTPDKLYLKDKNLLYLLNNPSADTLERSPSPQPTAPESEEGAMYYPKLVINLSNDLANDFQELRALLCRVFPGWKASDIEFKKLTGGITNMLLSVKCEGGEVSQVLIRVYGHGTNLIIDRHREFILHMNLNLLGLAPALYLRFKNGVIYGFLPGRSLDPSELSDPNLYPLIAQQLGNWHAQVDYKLIEQGVEKLRNYTVQLKRQQTTKSTSRRNSVHKKRFISNIYELLEDWISIVPINANLIKSFNTHLAQEVTEDNIREVIGEEFLWLQGELSRSPSPVVASHCDLLSGNIIVAEGYLKKFEGLPAIEDNPIKFIDYEYMLPAPRAFDIANHLAEWQGFDCDRLRVLEPSRDNAVLVDWCRGYMGTADADVDELIEEIATFYGLPGFYWGVWAMIQSEISNIDFNYAEYGEMRLQEYWDWKEGRQRK